MSRARSMVVWSMAVVGVSLVSTNPVTRALLALAAANVLLALRRGRGGLGPVVTMIAIGFGGSVVLNILLSHSGDHVLLRLPEWLPGIGGGITLESLAFGVATGLGVAVAILGFAPLGLGLDPHELIDATPPLLERTATALSASLALGPGVARTFTAIRDGQRMRGWRPRGLRSWSEVLVPVLVTAMEDSIQLAEAMEARAYASGPRTRIDSTPRSRGDSLVFGTAAGAVVLALAARVAGQATDWNPLPSVAWPRIDPMMVATALLLTTPVVIWRSRLSGG